MFIIKFRCSNGCNVKAKTVQSNQILLIDTHLAKKVGQHWLDGPRDEFIYFIGPRI